MSDYTTTTGGSGKGLLFAAIAIIGVIALLGFFGASTAPTGDGTAPAAVDSTQPAPVPTE